MALPPGTYGLRIFWTDGGCSVVRRASFELPSGRHFVFDFLVIRCPLFEPAREEILSEEEASARLKKSNPMAIPFDKQVEHYQEELFPAEPGRRPEIVVSFGKYRNRPDEIRYFPLHQVLADHSTVTSPPLPGLPVIVTVDRYTLRASEVVLDKKTMVFTAKGGLSVSDGQHNSTGTSATLSFSGGLPRLDIER